MPPPQSSNKPPWMLRFLDSFQFIPHIFRPFLAIRAGRDRAAVEILPVSGEEQNRAGGSLVGAGRTRACAPRASPRPGQAAGDPPLCSPGRPSLPLPSPGTSSRPRSRCPRWGRPFPGRVPRPRRRAGTWACADRLRASAGTARKTALSRASCRALMPLSLQDAGRRGAQPSLRLRAPSPLPCLPPSPSRRARSPRPSVSSAPPFVSFLAPFSPLLCLPFSSPRVSVPSSHPPLPRSLRSSAAPRLALLARIRRGDGRPPLPPRSR